MTAERQVTAAGKSAHKENGSGKLTFTPHRLRPTSRTRSVVLCQTQSGQTKHLGRIETKSKMLLGISLPNLWRKSISTSTRTAHATCRSPSQPPAAEGLGRKCSWIAHCWKSHLQQQTPRSVLGKAVNRWCREPGREPTASGTTMAGGEKALCRNQGLLGGHPQGRDSRVRQQRCPHLAQTLQVLMGRILRTY